MPNEEMGSRAIPQPPDVATAYRNHFGGRIPEFGRRGDDWPFFLS